MAIEEEKNSKKLLILTRKQCVNSFKPFLTMNLLSKVNLQKKADKQFPSGEAWKLWMELQGDFNPNDSITKTELELALSKLKQS